MVSREFKQKVEGVHELLGGKQFTTGHYHYLYNIIKSSVLHTSVTTNQPKKITNFNLLYLVILLLYKKEKKETKKKY